MTVVCRFAPSPTGNLHVGGARTALFNWAFARHCGGTFLLRVEDTDRTRSTQAFEQSINAALAWLRIQPDAPAVRQSERSKFYALQAQKLLEEGKAYRCYATPAELDDLRAQQQANGEKPRYDRRWRDNSKPPAGDPPFCLRFATPLDGQSIIADMVRGEVRMDNAELDDLVILRTDGSATYNFAAAVDDLDMGITHVIRGEDHLTNTFRQIQIYQAFTNAKLRFAHLPLIMGRKVDAAGVPVTNVAGDGVYERLSKRNAAVDVDQYRTDGFLAAGLLNYLAQLGWTQPGAEIYSLEELGAAFELSQVNRSAARFDLDRLRWVNQQHMRQMDATKLAAVAAINAPAAAIGLATEKAQTLVEMRAELSWLQAPKDVAANLNGQLANDNTVAFTQLCQRLVALVQFMPAAIKATIKECGKEHGLKFARLGMPLRVALTGKEQSPDIAEVAALIGQQEVVQRLANWLR